MTEPLRHCAWCGGPIPETGGGGRPRRYCRRSHRQRAFEARRAGKARGLMADEAIVSAESLAAWRDAGYLLEAAVSDARLDVTETSVPELRRALGDLIAAAEAAGGVSMEPRATAQSDS